MELFKRLSESMEVGSSVVITVAKTENGMAVSVLPGNKLVKDAAKNKLVPINMTGEPDEIDEGFLATILKPIASANGLLSNIKDFEASVEEAKKASEMEKKAKDEQKKVTEEFQGWFALAEQNYGENKFKDALTCISNAEKLSDKIAGSKSKIDAMRKKIKEALGEGNMFGSDVEDVSDGKNVKLGKSKPAASAPAAESSEEDDIEL